MQNPQKTPNSDRHQNLISLSLGHVHLSPEFHRTLLSNCMTDSLRQKNGQTDGSYSHITSVFCRRR